MESKPGDLAGLADVTTKTMHAEHTPASASASTTAIPRAPPAAVPADEEDVPDPEEDDLDDLDDMLDDFVTQPKPSTATNATTSTTSGPSSITSASTTVLPPSSPETTDDDLIKQLEAGMSSLLGGMDQDPAFKKEFEEMMKTLTNPASTTGAQDPAAPARAPTAAPSSTTSSSAAPKTFDATIRETMSRMSASNARATSSAAQASSAEDDFLAEMLKNMGADGLEGAGGEDFSKMLLGMMEQLTNKDILYEPMKELDDKFPAWLAENEGTVNAADMRRYRVQAVQVKEIVGKFEERGYSDSDAACREYIVERMQKMQEAGSPPPDLVGDMAAAQDAFGAGGKGMEGLEEGCAQQ